MKKKLLIITLLILLFNVICIYFFWYKNDVQETDSKKFKDEYSQVADNNVFVYRDINEIIKIMKQGTGIVYLGFPECPWCQSYVKYLNEVALEVGVDKIYYYNILKDRKENTSKYQEIVAILDNYLQYDDEGNKRIFVPNVSFHLKGKIVGNDSETSLDTLGLDNPSDYWTVERVNALKLKLRNLMKEVNTKMCTDCNK